MNLKYRIRQARNILAMSPLGSWASKLGRALRRIKWRRVRLLPGRGGLGCRSIIKLGVILLLLSVLLFPLVKYFSLPISRSPIDWEMESDPIIGQNTNVLLLVYDNEGGYSFVDGIAVLSIDQEHDNYNLMVLSSDFSSRVLGERYTKLRNFPGNSVNQNISPLKSLTDAVETMIGISVNRYIAVEKDNLLEVQNVLGLGTKVTTALSDPDAGSFEQGEYVQGIRLQGYLAAESEGLNAKMQRQAQHLGQMLAGFANVLSVARITVNVDKVVSSLETDMSRGELVGLGLALLSAGNIDTGYIGVEDTFVAREGGAFHLVPDTSVVDDKVRKVFGLIEVAREQARIEIYNATGTTGLASKYRRFLYNLGATIIRVGNFPDREEGSKLYVSEPERYKENVLTIIELLGGQVEVIEEVYPLNHTGELVLVLGENAL